jgi:hypothetical protein
MQALLDGGAGTVMSVPIAGGNAATLASGQATPLAIAIDATAVYWATAGPTLRKW